MEIYFVDDFIEVPIKVYNVEGQEDSFTVGFKILKKKATKQKLRKILFSDDTSLIRGVLLTNIPFASDITYSGRKTNSLTDKEVRFALLKRNPYFSALTSTFLTFLSLKVDSEQYRLANLQQIGLLLGEEAFGEVKKRKDESKIQEEFSDILRFTDTIQDEFIAKDYIIIFSSNKISFNIFSTILPYCSAYKVPPTQAIIELAKEYNYSAKLALSDFITIYGAYSSKRPEET